MYCAKMRNAFTIAVFAAAFAFGLQAARAQETSASSPTGASSAKTNATTGSAPVGGGGASSGSSSWIAGGGSFGTQKQAQPSATWGASRAASSQASSWTAGKASFKSASQPGGVWIESPAPGATGSKTPAHGLGSAILPHSRFPARVGLKPAAPSGRSGGTSRKAQISRASTRPRNGITSKSRAGAFKSPRARYSTSSVGSHSGSKRGGNAGKKTETGSGLDSTLPTEPLLR